MAEIKKDYGDRDPVTEKIIGICYEIHNALGPGFVERIYFNALKISFQKNNIKFEAEKNFQLCLIKKR